MKVGGLLVLIALGLLAPLSVSAAPPPPPTPKPLLKEPDRFAYVAGVSEYTVGGGQFDDLLTACDEAVKVRASLLKMGWAQDHIFPKVQPVAGRLDEAAVRTAICNQKNEPLQKGLQAFSNMLLDNKANFGFVYLSGHGAQSSDTQYFFGADAQINFDTEIARASASPSYKTLNGSGVDVLGIFDQLARTQGRAVLIMIDACRNNAALEAYKARVAKAAQDYPNNPLLTKRLSADYYVRRNLTTDYDKRFSNIVVLFSTLPGTEAAGASAGKTTDFANTVLTLFDDQDLLKESGSAFAEETVKRMIEDQTRQPDTKKQIAQKIGVMGRKPVFCFKDCPQPAASWPTDDTVVIAAAPPAASALAANAVKPTMSRSPPNPLLAKAFYQAPPAASAATRVPRAVMTEQVERLAPSLRSMNVDVFYCLGGGNALNRQANATRYAQKLRLAIPATRTINGYYLDKVRLRSFDPLGSPGTAKGKSGTSIWIDSNSALERTWSQVMANVDGTVLPVKLATSTPDYISVFFCDDLRNDAPTSTVYTQVSTASHVTYAQKIVADISGALPSLKFEPRIEAVDDKYGGKPRTPQNTEVRYYRDDQKADVDQLVTQLNSRLRLPAKAVKFVTTGKVVNPIIEIWFGQQETVAWRVG
jgi:hypothetical protein